MGLLSGELALLPRLMDAAELRHRVVSQNLANVNTPGYKRLDVSFEEALQGRLREAASGERDGIKPTIHEEPNLPARADGNNVDMDRELSQLNKNALLYQTYSQVLASYFDSMRRAIKSGP